MDSKFLVPAIGWGLLALAVLALAIYRWSIGSREDDQIHLNAGEANVSNIQAALAQRLEAIDKVGKSLTVVMVLYGAGLLAWAVRDALTSSSVLSK